MGCMDDDTSEANAIMARYKTMPCRKCTKPMTVGIRTRKAPIHVECGIEEAIQAAKQMREKKGPYYEKWLASMAKKFSNAGGGGAPPTGGEG